VSCTRGLMRARSAGNATVLFGTSVLQPPAVLPCACKRSADQGEDHNPNQDGGKVVEHKVGVIPRVVSTQFGRQQKGQSRDGPSDDRAPGAAQFASFVECCAMKTIYALAPRSSLTTLRREAGFQRC